MRRLVERRLVWAMAVVMLLGLGGVVAAIIITMGVWPAGDGSQGATAAQIVGGGGAPPSYLEPVPIVPGDYVPPWEEAGAMERGIAAVNADSQKGQFFTGTVGEFRLYGFDQPFSVEKKRCVAVDFALVDTLKFNYLLPGTKARGPQYAGVCADGSVQFVLQEFTTRNTSFDIAYEPGERAFGHEASAERISATTIGGRPAVVIRPSTEEGYGRSSAAVATDNGFIGVDAHELPLAETVKIAEGVECASC
jgi:hypothetical protein